MTLPEYFYMQNSGRIVKLHYIRKISFYLKKKSRWLLYLTKIYVIKNSLRALHSSLKIFTWKFFQKCFVVDACIWKSRRFFLILYMNRSRREWIPWYREHIWRMPFGTYSELFTGSAFQWHRTRARSLFGVKRIAHACLWVTPLAVHSRPEVRSLSRSIGQNARDSLVYYCEGYSWKIPFNTSSWRLSLIAQHDDNKASASLAPSRRYTAGEKLTILILLITAESRNAIFFFRYCTISTGNFVYYRVCYVIDHFWSYYRCVQWSPDNIVIF